MALDLWVFLVISRSKKRLRHLKRISCGNRRQHFIANEKFRLELKRLRG